jgi:putative heme degradation protein
MSPDPFFHLDDLDAMVPSSLDCTRICPRAGQSGFSSARIHPDCLHIENNGTVRVGLSVPAVEWFAILSGLGETLSLSRNSLAVLGQLGGVPVLDDWRNGVLPRESGGLYSPNLAERASLCAVRELSPTGLIHSLEMRDVSGAAFQKVILSEGSHRDLFEQFVTDHQSPSSEAVAWVPANHAASTHRWRGIASRIPLLRFRASNGARDVQRMEKELLTQILQSAGRANFPVRTTIYARGAITGAVWIPKNYEFTDLNPVQFFHGDLTGLHLNHAQIESVWLWRGRCLCCDDERWTIEVGTARDEIGLAVAAGSEATEGQWRNLLSEICL